MPYFKDVSTRTKFYTEIEWARSAGLLGGWDDGTFRPLNRIHRDAMAAVLYRLAGSPHFVPPAAPSFRDVPPGTKFFHEIEWVKHRGLLNGWDDGTFRPVADIERGATAALFYRTAGRPAFTVPRGSPFEDVRTTHPFYKEICWLAAPKPDVHGRAVTISSGWTDGTFRPGHPTARDAMAAFLHRFDRVV